MATIECISAVTLATRDMARAVAFYEALGFRMAKGGPAAEFTTFQAGAHSLNLIAARDDSPHWNWWGRVIFYVSDVDDMYRIVVSASVQPAFSPRNAAWGERYFHVTDPDGHELSFAAPLSS